MNIRRIIGFYLVFLSGIYIVSGQDNIPPDRPYITYVSVDTATNNVEVHWTESPSLDVVKYYIYNEILTINGYEGIKIDSVSVGNSIYIHSNSGAGQKNILYSVTAVDTAGNESLRKPGLHSTVYSNIYYDSCNNAIIVFWNKYVGWDNNVSGYRIFGREGAGNYQLLNGNNANDTSYTVLHIKNNTHYYFFIEAVKNDGLVSRSNIIHKYTFAPAPPAVLMIDYATVIDDHSVEIKFEFSDTSQINDFALLRSSVINSDYNIIQRIMDVQASPLIILDTFLTRYQSFFYRVGALNTCLSVIDTSNLANNILLTGINTNKINTLSWNSYRIFPEGVQSYDIYRADLDGNYNLIGTNSPGNTEFTDDLSVLYGEKYIGKIKYKVQAIENFTGNESVSNICEIEIRTDMILPNAFTPNQDGKNDVFKPVMNFIPKEYLFIIYNRYGIIIFKSKDPEKGWDGRINENNLAPEGVYTYHIEYTSYNGQKKVIKPGTLTLFYP